MLLLALCVYIAFQISPWPSALLVRNQFVKGGLEMNKIIEKHAPHDIQVTKNIHYDTSDGDAYLDVYYPKEKTSSATIVWVHGGGWLAGNKDANAPWARVFAGKGFTVAMVGYSLAPEKHYPLPVQQVNRSIGYLSDHSEELSIDKTKFVLAGDSAGAQIAAQVALLTTNPDYSSRLGISPTIQSQHVIGLLLNCGPYDLSLVNPDSNSDGARIVRLFLWSYTGKKDFYHDPTLQYASIPQYVTSNFPPSFITAGNADPLLPHSVSLANALKEVHVRTDTLFYPEDYSPALNHEYQFNLDTKEGQKALDAMTDFVHGL